jgi:hypothetical protein
LQILATGGFAVEALTGITLDLAVDADPVSWFAQRGWHIEKVSDRSWSFGTIRLGTVIPPHLRLTANGVPVTLHRGPTTRHRPPDDAESWEYLRLFESIMDRFRHDIVLGYGGDGLQRSVFARPRELGAVTVFGLHNGQYRSIGPFRDIDAVIVPSPYAAEHYQRTLGLDCTVLPNFIRPDRVVAEGRGHRQRNYEV